jgi:hypothetical protein
MTDDPFATLEEAVAKQSAQEQALKALAQARCRLIMDREAKGVFFATLALKLTPEVDWSLETMATDGAVRGAFPNRGLSWPQLPGEHPSGWFRRPATMLGACRSRLLAGKQVHQGPACHAAGRLVLRRLEWGSSSGAGGLWPGSLPERWPAGRQQSNQRAAVISAHGHLIQKYLSNLSLRRGASREPRSEKGRPGCPARFPPNRLKGPDEATSAFQTEDRWSIAAPRTKRGPFCSTRCLFRFQKEK